MPHAFQNVGLLSVRNYTRTSGRGKSSWIFFLALMPITAFGLGTWQVQRLKWKKRLIESIDERLANDPIQFQGEMKNLDEFEYRKVIIRGQFIHGKEILVGPRIRDGKNGYFVITPLHEEHGSQILINRGWIAKEHADQASRAESLSRRETSIIGLLRKPVPKNWFTPKNRPDKSEFYYLDLEQFAQMTGSMSVLVERMADKPAVEAYADMLNGIPIPRSDQVDLRNAHLQYIVTWYALLLGFFLY